VSGVNDPVVQWVRSLTLEQLQDAESACACWPTREGAAEALRRALFQLAYRRPVTRGGDPSDVNSGRVPL
jgi:hypothetical protein